MALKLLRPALLGGWGFTLLLLAPLAALQGEEPIATPARANSKAKDAYLLRYQFLPGQSLRWEVEHRAQVRMTVSGNTQTAETLSQSVKLWKVASVDQQGQATFIHSVESVSMRQEMNGKSPVTYNSLTDAEPPTGYQDVAKAVGIPLSTITIDRQGKIIKRIDNPVKQASNTQYITIPLPDDPVEIGHSWSFPDDLVVTTRDGQQKKIQRRQQLRLEEVKNGIASIQIETQVLTPVNDPGIEAQLVQGELNGRLRFDIEAGCVVSQQMDLDKHVVGVQGEASSMRYTTRFTERLLPPGERTAAKPKIAGPPLP